MNEQEQPAFAVRDRIRPTDDVAFWIGAGTILDMEVLPPRGTSFFRTEFAYRIVFDPSPRFPDGIITTWVNPEAHFEKVPD